MSRYAAVVTDLAVDKTFDYLVPPSLYDGVVPGVRVVIPFRSGRRLAYVISVSEGGERPGVKPVLSVRDRRPVLDGGLLRLAAWMASYYCCPLSTAIRCMIPAGVRRGRGARARILVRALPGAAGQGEEVGRLSGRAPAQARALRALLDHGRPFPMSELIKRAKVTGGAIRALEKKGFVALTRERVFRDPWEGEETEPSGRLPATPEQSSALAHLVDEIGKRAFSVTLLHGVTGSGKTEVYLQAIDEALRRGRGAIVLVPEIALTPQTVETFKARFSESVAVLHSRLSEGERLDEWDRLRERRARVVVGARSAVFAPVPDLGLIVLDEEHERSYKQEEAPRYHARDVAVMRGRIERAVVILGSATPSIESYHRAERGEYAVFSLPRRIKDRSLPKVTVVDMKEEARRSGRMFFFSRRLLSAMDERLARGEQVILLLNRRGYSPVIICGKCGHVRKCPHCSVSLTLHLSTDRMLCHICGHQSRPPKRCPRCRSGNLRLLGAGTQKLEAVLSRLFPEYRVGRMDSDAMSGKGAHARVLRAFKSGELEILLGTQMIAKGLHIPNVTLVGVISADTSLNLPDFRASEQTFQLLTQVAGRAGRGDIPGEVIIQTYAPRHPAILAAREHDYSAFYERELTFREELGYPPAARLVLATVRGRNEEAVKWIAGQFRRMLGEAAPPGTEILGPAPSPIGRAKGYYRRQIICKGGEWSAVNEALKNASERLKPCKNIHIVLDVDPVSML